MFAPLNKFVSSANFRTVDYSSIQVIDEHEEH